MKKSIQVVNTLTGEVTEFNYSNPTELRAIAQQAKAAEDTIKRARAKINLALEQLLGDDDSYDFGDGFKIIRIQGYTKKYPRAVVAEYLDEDQLDIVSEINGRKLKDLLTELVKEGAAPQGAWKSIEAAAESTPHKPFVKLEKS